MAEFELKKNGRPEGGTIAENVKLNARKRIVVNPDFAMSKINVKEVDSTVRKFRCCMCGSTYTTQKGNFPSGGASPLWKGNNGFLPFCKGCCDALMENLMSFYSGNEEHALRHMCHMFDWYYCDYASAMTHSQVRADGSFICLYPSKANARQVVQRGTTFLDTIRDEYKYGDPSVEVVDIITDDNNEDDFVVTKEMIRTWGRGYTAEQYQYLEEQYADWCNKNVCKTKTQEELYKNIAIAQLNIRIAQMNGNSKAVSEAMDALQKLMNSANILPKQTADNILADTQTFGTLLKKFEDTDPIPEPSERWKDVDGIRRYMNTWFRGGLAKALKIGNENTRLYDEAVAEMERYTVKPESVANTDSTNDASIFDTDKPKDTGDNSE